MAAKKTEEKKSSAKQNTAKPAKSSKKVNDGRGKVLKKDDKRLRNGHKFSAAQIASRKDKLSDVYTKEGKRLTVKEEKFINAYINNNNLGKSAIEAGYKCGEDEEFARQVGNKLVQNPYIKAEIQARMEQAKTSSIADRQEIMQFFSDMMRGKILDQFDMPTTNADKIKAAQELAKRSIDFEDRLKEKAQATVPEIKISLDWGGAHGKKE